MSSTGPGSLLVFLAFLMLSMLLTGTYFVAYLGLVQAGREVQKAGEAASEQAIVYLFQHPTNVSMVDGSPVVKGETRIVVQNVGSRDISFDRILAISPDGSVVADIKVPGNKGLGVRQWQLYKVQDLGLPERWNNFTVFSSEVSRLVLLSERGRTHGSIWGVPPFLEGILRATVATTMTTSYFYSYIETTSYSTVFTITIRHRQSAYSLTGEWWESDDGKNWGKVTDTSGRDNQAYSCWNSGKCSERVWDGCCSPTGCFGFNACAASYSVGPQSPTASQLITTLTANGRQVVRFGTPIILYFRANESVVASAGTTSYNITGSNTKCIDYGDECVKQYTEWSRTYKLQAIELVDWDTGEVYASLNQTSLTFNIYRNTIVRFKYVLTSSWSRTWEVIIWTRPPPSNPADCQQILNEGLPGTWEWCACAKMLNDERYKRYCGGTCRAYFVVNFYPCCSGGRGGECIQAWSGPGVLKDIPFDCDNPPAPQKITLSVQASWTPAPGWRYHDWGWDGNADDCSLTVTGNSASGSCTASIPPDKSARIVIIFVKS